MGFGSILGVLISLQFKDVEFWLGLIFFSIQTTAVILVLTKNQHIGYALLFTSLIIQTPIINSPTISYRCQTLFSYYLMEFPGKISDLEPGSYLSWIEKAPDNFGKGYFPYGINLTSLAILVYFYRARNKTRKKQQPNSPS